MAKNKIGRIGLVINLNFHKNDGWVSALTGPLVNSIINEFNPLIISSQFKYNLYKHRLNKIIMMEPGWAAPKIKYGLNHNKDIYVFISDPHSKKNWLESYVNENNIKKILSYYYSPFYYHFPNFPKNKFVHMPWSIPDEQVNKILPKKANDAIYIFGGSNSDAYDFRNWCRIQDGIINLSNSGVENKLHTSEEYFSLLKTLGAVVAAGSTHPKYDLVTPKYFEIASSGSLLIGQHCNDLQRLGFNNKNSLIFHSKKEFIEKINVYRNNPGKYLKIRKRGVELIKERHLMSHRIKQIRNLIQD